MGKFTTFGEILLRLCPPDNHRLSSAGTLDFDLSGPEMSTAVSCANFGHSSKIISALPDNELTENVLRRMRYWNVDSKHVRIRQGRIGINYLELGSGVRPSRVLSDRENTVFSKMDSGEWDWPNTLYGSDWFHVSGVTPGISMNSAIATREAVKTARAFHTPVSLDLSYRHRLWSPEDAMGTLEPILEDIDLLVSTVDDLRILMGIEVPEPNDDKGRPPLEGYVDAARKVRERYGVTRVVLYIRYTDKQLNHSISAVMLDGKSLVVSRNYPTVVVDRLGSHDAFSGGLISLLMNGASPGEALEFAAAASCLKHSLRGEFNKVTKDEVHALMKGASLGQVIR